MDLLLQKLQSEYSKNRNSKTEDKLKHARATTSQIRKQLEQLTGEVSLISCKKWEHHDILNFLFIADCSFCFLARLV